MSVDFQLAFPELENREIVELYLACDFYKPTHFLFYYVGRINLLTRLNKDGLRKKDENKRKVIHAVAHQTKSEKQYLGVFLMNGKTFEDLYPEVKK